jgi:hypothetical protein
LVLLAPVLWPGPKVLALPVALAWVTAQALALVSVRQASQARASALRLERARV